MRFLKYVCFIDLQKGRDRGENGGRGAKEKKEKRKDRKDRQGGEKKKRENGSFWELLDRRQFAPHQSQNPSVKRLMS